MPPPEPVALPSGVSARGEALLGRVSATDVQWGAFLPGVRVAGGAEIGGRPEQRSERALNTLHQVLSERFKGERNFDYFLTQRGMFSYTGLNETQVNRLRDEFGVYLVRSGRMCMSGLSTKNVDYVANAMAQVL